ncbi:unnamed protein product [Ixodes hexagonus]
MSNTTEILTVPPPNSTDVNATSPLLPETTADPSASRSPEEGGSGFLGDAGPGMVIFLGALAVITIGVIVLLCVSVCITASKRAKRRAHFRNKIRNQCPPCPECNEPCKENPGVYHVDMCDVHGPVPPPPMPSVQEEEEEDASGNPFFVRGRVRPDRPERSAGGDSGVSSQADKTPDPFAAEPGDDRDNVIVSKPKFLQMPVSLFRDSARVDTKQLFRDSVDEGIVLPVPGEGASGEKRTEQSNTVVDSTAAKGQLNSAFQRDDFYQ